MKTSTALKIILPLTAAAALTAMVLIQREPGRREAAAPAQGAASGNSPVRCEGRVAAYPGFDVVVGTDLGGTLESMAVHEKDAVRKGQVLARIDDREQRASLEAAEARSANRAPKSPSRSVKSRVGGSFQPGGPGPAQPR
ncbi:MAG: biotin/lipoyl-binding protein [Holophagaceae bacterium]|nr:biotin/lipoyl-binding protein [Holophagaceae bacterium]